MKGVLKLYRNQVANINLLLCFWKVNRSLTVYGLSIFFFFGLPSRMARIRLTGNIIFWFFFLSHQTLFKVAVNWKWFLSEWNWRQKESQRGSEEEMFLLLIFFPCSLPLLSLCWVLKVFSLCCLVYCGFGKVDEVWKALECLPRTRFSFWFTADSVSMFFCFMWLGSWRIVIDDSSSIWWGCFRVRSVCRRLLMPGLDVFRASVLVTKYRE